MWKLVCDRGRQVWEYVKGQSVHGGTPDDFAFDFAKNRNSGDLIYRTQMLAKNYKEQPFPKDVKLPADPTAATALQSVHKGINFYQALQDPDGHWPGDYGGPMFLMPGFVIACYVTGTEIAPERRKEMIRYLSNHQQSDGGWGTHIEGESTVFGTALNYCAFRILGVEKDDPRAKRASAFLKREGGAVMSPSWGKFYLCVLGVFEWEGVNSLFPELWLTPYFLPVYPGRYWCHCRMVYLPMAYCYGTKFQGPLTPLVMSLREEIHAQPYNTIKWSTVRDSVAPRDRYFYPSWAVQLLFVLTNAYEKVHNSWLRKKAVKWIGEYIDAEDQQTLYVDIGPVNKVINFMCVYQSHGPKSPQFKKHVDRLWDYLWLAEDGMKMQGYNGSQLWDTAFATQAIIETGLGPRFSECLTKAYKYLEVTQVIEETPEREKWFRHIAKGAWPFSTRDHGWPISDCTSEGIKAVLLLHQLNAADGGLLVPAKGRISDQRMFDAINVVLSFQNGDGGWATYENTRGSAYLELINPSEVFGEIMIDYSHTECTSACLQSLVRFKAAYPTHRTAEIDRAVKNGIKFLQYKQRPEGNWYGFWGVCFTYGTWFAVEAFVAAGETVKTCPALKRGIDWLISAQLEDGGWGESYKSCVIKKYVPHTRSQIVNTAWALLALMAADYPDQRVIKKGVQVLLSRQKTNGDWDQEGISGVFNGNCMITYTAYRNVFPIWALGRYVQKYGALPQQNGKH